MNLSAVVLTNKDPNEIKPVLGSVAFADETIILRDHPQSDPLNGDFAAQRNLGLKRAKNDWVLFVDDDEIVSKELAREINATIVPSDFVGYKLRRLDQYYGQTLHHGETGNIKIIRLGKKNAGKFIRAVHETWQIQGRVGELKNPLLHVRQELVSSFINRIILYGPIDAKSLKEERKPFTYWRLFLNPLAKFVVNYKLKLGFLDGILGLFQAYLMSVQSLSIRVFQWQEK
ncbi:glycosyltransferase family 2 protein [Candidatus Collierbacteria bacterium]|nr:glycosyltransferase family 2 protein [Candidatus Collierbacteria bacterium]